MAKGRRDIWSEAIEKAERDLARIEKKLEGWQALMQRRDLLRNTIDGLKVLRGKGAPASTEGTAPTEPSTPKELLWQQVYFALMKTGTPQTPVQIAILLGVSKRNEREMIRQALNRKKAVFEKMSDGRYGLVDWKSREQGKQAVLASVKDSR